ncbi:hypothetical protein B0T16DRAFT_462256 [Cercophora newfieldiana]|uniref:Uncharacterized protein n=1 Tax=Cercophora newfieldiana TaxID=92897 RepID=A0AA39XQR0_9PEZI|nr:hypothetical protein B0T16DRAFT_462256 [Cercophora newfieldiana]
MRLPNPLHLTAFTALLSTSTAHPAPSDAAKTTSTTATSPFATRPASSRCGGFTREPNPCPKGLVCAPTQPPGTYDLPGTCILQTCGGKSPTLSPCPEGQVCVYNATAPMTDLPGRCMAAKLTCGGKGETCKSGWECLEEPRVDWNYREEFPEGKGICIPPGSLVVREPWRGWGVE